MTYDHREQATTKATLFLDQPDDKFRTSFYRSTRSLAKRKQPHRCQLAAFACWRCPVSHPHRLSRRIHEPYLLALSLQLHLLLTTAHSTFHLSCYCPLDWRKALPSFVSHAVLLHHLVLGQVKGQICYPILQQQDHHCHSRPRLRCSSLSFLMELYRRRRRHRLCT